MTECCRAPLYVIDFKAGQNFEGQVEPLELAAGRAHPILSLTLADGRQVSLAHPLRDRKSIPCGLSHTSVLLCAANSAAQLYLLWAPATRVADRDIGAVTLNLFGPESSSNDAGRSWPQARTTIIASMKLVIIRTPDMDVTDAQHCTSDVCKGRRESSALAKCHRAENQADSIELYTCACSSERDRLHGVDAIVVGYTGERICFTWPEFGAALCRLPDARYSLNSSSCSPPNVRSPIFQRHIKDVGVKG